MLNWKAGHDTEYDYSAGVSNAPKVPRPTYAGVTLGTTGRDERIMSDVWAWVTYALVWDGSRVKEVSVACSEFGSYADVVVDATDAVKAAAAAYTAKLAADVEKRAADNSIGKAIDYAKSLSRGKHVTVVKGRKVKIGTTGVIFWYGESKFGYRVGLELADGSRVFTAASNVSVTNPDEFLDIDELMARAADADAKVAAAAAALDAAAALANATLANAA